jgi:hypothetical protein
MDWQYLDRQQTFILPFWHGLYYFRNTLDLVLEFNYYNLYRHEGICEKLGKYNSENGVNSVKILFFTIHMALPSTKVTPF